MDSGELWTQASKRYEVKDSTPPGRPAPLPARETTKQRLLAKQAREAQRRAAEQKRQEAIAEFMARKEPRRPLKPHSYEDVAEAMDHELIEGGCNPSSRMRRAWSPRSTCNT